MAKQKSTIAEFQKYVWDYYKKNKRSFPWREKSHFSDPYKIIVSEVMLQQTQAGRVVEKYESFIKKFPTFKTLHAAPVSEVIRQWQGLGYNRRAVALKKIAEQVVGKWGDNIPKSITIEELDAFPHIGRATACSISVFAWNVRAVFIETNIRRAFIHHFFPHKISVSDEAIFPLIEQALPSNGKNRDWYYALMDYGAMLKTKVANPNRKSVGYRKQAAFKGSNREVRGCILKLLGQAPRGSLAESVIKEDLVTCSIDVSVAVLEKNLQDLTKEGFLERFEKRGKFVRLVS